MRNIYFNIQNDEIIIRNIKDIKTRREKDIVAIIQYEINQYMPIDLQNYIIKYKKIINMDNEKYIQGILFPRKFVYICNKISEKLNIKKRYLHINFDILQKLMDRNLIELKDQKVKELVLIENRVEDIIFNKISNKKIIESFVINKLDNNLKNLLKEIDNKYYFGLDDEYIKNMEIPKIHINNKLILSNSENEIDESSRYLSSWGMII